MTRGTTVRAPVDAAEEALPGAPADPPRRVGRKEPWGRVLRRDWQLYSLALLPLLFFLVFRYLPMLGNVIAFRRFQPGGSIFGEDWVGLRYVLMFLSDPTFWQVFTNTLLIGALTLLFCFPLPIVLALLLNEVRVRWFKRFVQTVSYLPHFLSIVIVAGMLMQLLSVDGTVNQIVRAFGGEALPLPAAAGVVPHDLRVVRGVADRRVGHDPLPRRAHHHRREPLRGRAHRRRQPAGARPGTSRCPASAPPWSRC